MLQKSNKGKRELCDRDKEQGQFIKENEGIPKLSEDIMRTSEKCGNDHTDFFNHLSNMFDIYTFLVCICTHTRVCVCMCVCIENVATHIKRRWFDVEYKDDLTFLFAESSPHGSSKY